MPCSVRVIVASYVPPGGSSGAAASAVVAVPAARDATTATAADMATDRRMGSMEDLSARGVLPR
jgi:hypothetical protein